LLKPKNNAIPELETLVELHAVTQTANSRESIKNAVLLSEPATNSQDAKEQPPLDFVDLSLSRDLTPDALFLEPPRENVTEKVSVHKQIRYWKRKDSR